MDLRGPTTVIALSLAIVLASATGAFAYWTVNGSGSGTATAATLKPFGDQTGRDHGTRAGSPCQPVSEDQEPQRL